MRIAIISIYSFPFGLAPTNRILAYSKGMVQNGAFVKVYIPFPTDNYISQHSLEKNGIFQGIQYSYISGRFKSKRKIFRALSVITGFRKILGYFLSLMKIIKENRSIKFDYLIISSDYIPTLFFYSLLAKIINIKPIFIFDEYPVPIRHKLKNRIPLWKEFIYKIILKNINGYISISENLKNYYNNLSQKKTLILSTITDVSRFDIPKQIDLNIHTKEYICYMGNMELSKDNVDNIIEAFALISEKYPKLEFHLYGNPNLKTIEILKIITQRLKLENRIFIKGRANYNDVPLILKRAKVLVSSQPDTIRASGGFPTKLGEYLASGVPALITDVGENSKYVNDKEHIFFSKPEDPTNFAEKLNFILNDYDFALKVAKTGEKFLFNIYSHTKQGLNLLTFLKTLSN